MIKKVSKSKSGLNGCINIPSDKSISHRAVILGGIANGVTIVKNFSSGKDPHSSLSIMRALGVNIEQIDASTLKIVSNGRLNKPQKNLDCGNSGTTMRLLSGVLAGQSFSSVLVGDKSLSNRPMKRVIEPLSLMGAKIESVENHAPLTIWGGNLNAITYNSPIASAQVKSCLLLAGLYADGETLIDEPFLSRNHSELMLEYFGADICAKGTSVKIKKSQLQGTVINVCGDISSAAYFIVAGLIVPNSDLILKNVGLNPTRTGILDVAKRMGGDIQILSQQTISGELCGDIRVKTSELRGCEISSEIIPRLIDEIPIIAVLATQAQGETIIKGAQDLRNKESDRISAIVTELRKLGADVEEFPDGLRISGQTRLKGDCELDVYNDHRLAMSLYVAGLVCDKEVAIRAFEWVSISFPEFESLFGQIQAN